MRKALFTASHPQVAESLNSVGGAFDALGKYEQALEYSKQALVMQKELFDGDHPAVAQSLNNVGVAYGRLGQYTEALEHC